MKSPQGVFTSKIKTFRVRLKKAENSKALTLYRNRTVGFPYFKGAWFPSNNRRYFEAMIIIKYVFIFLIK